MVAERAVANSEGLKLKIAQQTPFALEVELNCGPGEILALFGPSGSGKTTVLRAIAGLHHPAHGHISCAGESWLDTTHGQSIAPQHRRVGMVFQAYALFPHMTALQNVMAAVPRRHSATAEQRARTMLAKVHLQGLEQRRPHELSGGQQQRVALARALAREPSVLLLDEPFSAVDRSTRESLHTELMSLRRDLAMPVVLVTHDLDDAVMLSDRMILLSGGRVLQTGSPLYLRRRPVSVEAARLLGLRNLFDGQVLRHDPAENCTHIAWAGLELRVPLCVQYPVGCAVHWCIPGEGIRLADEAIPISGTNRVEGIVTGVQCFSDRWRLALEPTSGTTLFCDLAHTEEDRMPRVPGTRLAVQLASPAIHVMPAAGPDRVDPS